MKYVDSDIKKLGTILGIWAHPDDESWASAGIMITAAANGQRTACVTATKGEAGETDEKRWPKKSLAAFDLLFRVNEIPSPSNPTSKRAENKVK